MHIERKTRFRMLLRPVVFAFVATLTSAIPLEAHAETVHHWRFEDGAFHEEPLDLMQVIAQENPSARHVAPVDVGGLDDE